MIMIHYNSGRQRALPLDTQFIVLRLIGLVPLRKQEGADVSSSSSKGICLPIEAAKLLA
jgi:hypothetical protein